MSVENNSAKTPLAGQKRALITGIAGFAGSHLCEYLLSRGYEVYGTIRPHTSLDNLLGVIERTTLLEADVSNEASLRKAIAQAEPDYLFHLAAQSAVPASWKDPRETFRVNVIGTVNVLEAIRCSKVNPVVQIAGTGEEYGLVQAHEIPIRETNPLRPQNPHAVSKLSADLLSIQYHAAYGLKVVVTRSFNHEGPRRSAQFATSAFALQLAEIEYGLREPIMRVGNLESRRDFTDVRDMVQGYELAVTRGTHGEQYNLCSGQGRSIKSVLETLIALAQVTPKIQNDPSRMRPSDTPITIGDNTKFREKTGWKPIIPFVQTMQDTLNYWRDRVRTMPTRKAST